MINHLLLASVLAASTLLGMSSRAEANIENRPAAIDPRGAVRDVAMTLVFSSKVDLSSSAVKITDASGNRVETGSLRLGADTRNLEVPLAAPLRPGVYSISWHAVSIDGQDSVGGYDFTIDPVGKQSPAMAQQ